MPFRVVLQCCNVQYNIVLYSTVLQPLAIADSIFVNVPPAHSLKLKKKVFPSNFEEKTLNFCAKSVSEFLAGENLIYWMKIF